MLDLSSPNLSDLIECGHAIRRLGCGAASMEDAAQRTTRLLYETLRDPDGRPGCPLVRFFKTHPSADLPNELKRLVSGPLGSGAGLPEGVRCLTLLGTSGDVPAWNDRRASTTHQAIPLVSQEGLARAPMIAQLVRQLGLDAVTVIRPDPAVILDL